MIKKIISKIFYVFWKYSGLKNIEKSLALLAINNIYSNHNRRNSPMENGHKVYSQQDEDGIIEEIFNRIGVKKKLFIEIGLETGIECNTTYLLQKNWSGLWIEGNQKYKERIYKHFKTFIDKKKLDVCIQKVYPSNINNLIEKYFEKNKEIDLLSVDIGPHTFHVLEKLDILSPRVIVAEYNPKFGPTLIWKIKYSENLNWDGSDNFGASLKCFQKMMEEKNYKLVCCNVTGVNAFFVRNDCINELFDKSYESEDHFMEGRNWLKIAFDKNYPVKV